MRRLLPTLALVLGFGLAGCTDTSSEPVATTQYVTVRRPWRPGERDSVVARIVRTRQFVFPFVGDLSDNADDILPLDSTTETVPNPDWEPSAAVTQFGPAYDVARVPGTGWTTVGLDLHVVNNQQGGDTFDYLGALWYNDADSTWKGIVLAGGASGASLAARTVNNAPFEAANQKSGAGAGEARFSDGTIWLANGTGSPDQFSVSFALFFGSTTTVTDGPYTGGTSRNGLMNININNVGLARAAGSGAPVNQTASISGFVGATQLTCIFPSPCTGDIAETLVAASEDTDNR